MNDEMKLISESDLHDIISNYIEHISDAFEYHDKLYWNYIHPYKSTFYWELHDSEYNIIIFTIGCWFHDNQWTINTSLVDGNKTISIQIFNDHVEFIEDSVFYDFDRKFMHGIYEKIKDYVEGGNKDNESTSDSINTINELRSKPTHDDITLFQMGAYTILNLRSYKERHMQQIQWRSS